MIRKIQNFSVAGWVCRLFGRVEDWVVRKPGLAQVAVFIGVPVLALLLAMGVTECEHQRNQEACEEQATRSDCLVVEYISGRVCMCWLDPASESEAYLLRRD